MNMADQGKDFYTIAKSQKVKGLVALKDGYVTHIGGDSVTPILHLIQSIKDAKGVKFLSDGKKITYFARPCPTLPRHGFVDSRVVESMKDLLKVFLETREADPNGEVMLTRPLDCANNAVWTPGFLTIGEGNDGATAGKDTINIPLGGKGCITFAFGKSVDEALFKRAGIGKDQWPYVEVVWQKGYPHSPILTQLRAGPIIEGGSEDFCPTPIDPVRKVIKVDQSISLLEWEKLMDQHKGVEGVVVWHPGGSMVDHFAVHARCNGIPIFTTREVVEGESLDQIQSTPPAPSSVLRGIAASDRIELDLDQNDGKHAVTALLMGLHFSSNLGGDQGWRIGMAVGLMIRLGVIALRGEARHIKSKMPDRQRVYRQASNHTLTRHRGAVSTLIHIFRYGDFGGGGVGGLKWAQCGVTIVDLINSVRSLARDPSGENVNKMILTLNTAVNQAHNGGWWLNKFASQDQYVQVPLGSVKIILAAVPFLLKAEEAQKKLTTSQFEALVGKYKGWKEVTLKPHQPKEATIYMIPGLSTFQVILNDRAIPQGKYKTLNVPVEALLSHIPDIKGNLYVVPTDQGLSVEWRRPHMDPITLFEEKGVTPQKQMGVVE